MNNYDIILADDGIFFDKGNQCYYKLGAKYFKGPYFEVDEEELLYEKGTYQSYMTIMIKGHKHELTGHRCKERRMYKNGKLHCEHGPAITNHSKSPYFHYYWNGVRMEKPEWEEIVEVNK